MREMDITIRVSSVTKRFKLYHNIVTGPIMEALFFWRRQNYYKEFLAVRDVSFEVRKGEVVGIIGPNGAGKTTLLKMIAGLLPIDGGEIEVRGRITALLALGVGVHPEFTGRENIFYGGMLLGMSKREVLSKMPGIVEFSELGRFIEQPFRTYSSGMKARLLFSISMSISPDILIVDEALATGDSYFVQKSSQRIREICASGATILFVSHNLSQIQQLCDRAYFMAEGRFLVGGDPREVISAYHQWVFEKEKSSPMVHVNRILQKISGSGEVDLTDVRTRNMDGEETTGFHSGEGMEIEIHYRNHLDSAMPLDLFIGICDSIGHQFVGEIMSARPLDKHHGNFMLRPKGIIRVRIEALLLLTGHYYLWLMGYSKGRAVFEYRDVTPFFCSRQGDSLLRDAIFRQPATWIEV